MCEPFRSFDKPLKTSVFNWFKNSTYFWHYDQARYPPPLHCSILHQNQINRYAVVDIVDATHFMNAMAFASKS